MALYLIMRKLLCLIFVLAVLAFALPVHATTCPTITAGPIQAADVTFTFTNGSAVLTGTNTYVSGQPVQIFTSGTVATNFATLTPYYVISTGLSGTQFELSATQGGSAITAGSAGSGVQTAAIYSLWPSTASVNLGDVVQWQFNTPSVNYVDDDEATNATITLTDPSSTYSVTWGMFLLNAHVNGVNTPAARWAAGNAGGANGWHSGTWTYSINYSDHSGLYACTATGSVTVSSTFDSANGFLRQVVGSSNLYTDGNNKIFFPTGESMYFVYYSGSANLYGVSEIPTLVYVNVSGTSVTPVSGTFPTETLPSSVSNAIYISNSSGGAIGTYTLYPNVTVTSSAVTLNSSGGTLSNVPAYLFFFRDIGIGGGHAYPPQATLQQSALFAAAWGTTFNRFSDANSGPTLEVPTTGWLGTGYNNYNWNTATGFSAWGLQNLDTWYAAAHAAGIHLMYGGPPISVNPALSPCPSPTWICTSTEKQNLQNLYGMVGARYAAFYDIFEVNDEGENIAQTYLDDVGAVVVSGVSGIAGGHPADPYQHFFTQSYFPSSPIAMPSYSPTYGPYSSPYVADAYLNLFDIPHDDNEFADYYLYNYMSTFYGHGQCLAPNNYGGTSPVLPMFQGEEAMPIGRAPATQSASSPNNEQNGVRILNEQALLNQCGTIPYNLPNLQVSINSSTPITAPTWYDARAASATLQTFLAGIDTAVAPITVTLGGGFNTNAGAYAGLGSTNHIRLVLNSASGTTAVPNTVTAGTVTITIPQPSMTLSWWNLSTGTIISSVTTSGTAGSQTFTAPTFTYDMGMSVDPAAASSTGNYCSGCYLGPGSTMK